MYYKVHHTCSYELNVLNNTKKIIQYYCSFISFITLFRYSLRQMYKLPFSSPQKSATHYESSSCSSLSSTSTHWGGNVSLRGESCENSDEDFTLNEMMGKYDESYIYEKETDILSDSDPTDGEIDTDTGEDFQSPKGGDKELDFIDNDSYHESLADYKSRHNTGNCFYYTIDSNNPINFRNSKRGQKLELSHYKHSGKRRRSCHQKTAYKNRQFSRVDPKLPNVSTFSYTRSAENTPISIRKTKHPISKLVLNDTMKKRSNSISFSKESVSYFDQRDREASKKYKQLIVEAEHILNNIKVSTMSPKRLAPTNKRVEMLRTAESSSIKVEEIKKNFNHITIPPKEKRIVLPSHLQSSPILMRKQSTLGPKNVTFAKRAECATASCNSPIMQNKYNNKNGSPSRKSPKYKRRNNKLASKKYSKDSSDTDTEVTYNTLATPRLQQLADNVTCYSEPVKRKVYSKTNGINLNRNPKIGKCFEVFKINLTATNTNTLCINKIS